MKQNFIPSSQDLLFLPLGGSGEIGMNLSLYGHNKKWIIVDLGITFYDRLGIEIIVPNPEFILKNLKNIEAIIITHAHEDHIGAIIYLWPQIRCPIYTTQFTAIILHQKLEKFSWKNQVSIITVFPLDKNQIGPFLIEWVPLTHSIPESYGLLIRTPIGNIFHTGDWKIDNNPLLGDSFCREKIKKIGNEGILGLVCDSTNIFVDKSSGSESSVYLTIKSLLNEYSNYRIIFTCFASNIARIKSVLEIASNEKRKIVLLGSSLKRMINAARLSKFLENTNLEIIKEKNIINYPDNKILIIVTGSQGEKKSVLSRIASNTHTHIKIKENDLIIFSSRVIPGNERSISIMQNQLISRGAKIITAYRCKNIHVSGHPSKEELRKMYRYIKPKMVIPVHGELQHLEAHKDFAESIVGNNSSIAPRNGEVIQLAEKNQGKILFKVAYGKLAYDGNRLVSLDGKNVTERNQLSLNGALFITLNNNYTKNKFEFTSFGITENDIEKIKLEKSLNSIMLKTIRNKSKSLKFNQQQLIENIKESASQVIEELFNKKPVIIVHYFK